MKKVYRPSSGFSIFFVIFFWVKIEGEGEIDNEALFEIIITLSIFHLLIIKLYK